MMLSSSARALAAKAALGVGASCPWEVIEAMINMTQTNDRHMQRGKGTNMKE